MRIIVSVAALTLSTLAYAQQPTFNVPALERDCASLVAETRVPAKAEVVLPLKGLPPSIEALHPRRVSVDKEGVHISLQPSGTHASELFYLPERSVVSDSWVVAHGFTRVGDRLYTSNHDG